MFEDLENKLNSTQKQIQQKISSYENDLESIQKQIEHLAYDSGLVDLSTPESSPWCCLRYQDYVVQKDYVVQLIQKHISLNKILKHKNIVNIITLN